MIIDEAGRTKALPFQPCVNCFYTLLDRFLGPPSLPLTCLHWPARLTSSRLSKVQYLIKGPCIHYEDPSVAFAFERAPMTDKIGHNVFKPLFIKCRYLYISDGSQSKSRDSFQCRTRAHDDSRSGPPFIYYSTWICFEKFRCCARGRAPFEHIRR